LIYPSAFPPGSRTGKCGTAQGILFINVRGVDVAIPTSFGLPYEDVSLVTSDNVKIKCYLLTQRKELDLAGESTISSPDGLTDGEVGTN
jgi:hypothetical protein